jgi:hypothetical protein
MVGISGSRCDRPGYYSSMAEHNGDLPRDEVERYRQAAEDALQQLDWCIGYLHGIRKVRISRSLARNRNYIRTRLMDRAEEPLPSSGS